MINATQRNVTPSITEPSRIAVFGATRGIGRELVRLAIASGQHVTALVRDPSRMDIASPQLTVVEGDATDPVAVRAAVKGVDAVVCALGAPAMSTSKVRSEGTRQIVQAMADVGVDRLVCISLLGARESRATLPFFLKYVFFPFYLRRAARDHDLQETLVEASDLCWTIVRPPHLTDGTHTGAYAHGFGDDLSGLTLKVSRADVADFVLANLESDVYERRVAGISYRR